MEGGGGENEGENAPLGTDVAAAEVGVPVGDNAARGGGAPGGGARGGGAAPRGGGGLGPTLPAFGRFEAVGDNFAPPGGDGDSRGGGGDGVSLACCCCIINVEEGLELGSGDNDR